MHFTEAEFKKLSSTYGKYAGWAIWNYSRSRDIERSTSIIDDNIALLNSRNVIVGLNVSAPIDILWSNFRGGTHDRKLKYAFNDTIRGSYITDLYKGIVNPSSVELDKYISKNPDILQENVQFFLEEMKSIRLSMESRFIILGVENGILARHFNKHFQRHFLSNPVVYYRHYSSRGTDKEWVEGIWRKLDIQNHFGSVLSKYKYVSKD
jgi:hypothetical protein